MQLKQSLPGYPVQFHIYLWYIHIPALTFISLIAFTSSHTLSSLNVHPLDTRYQGGLLFISFLLKLPIDAIYILLTHDFTGCIDYNVSILRSATFRVSTLLPQPVTPILRSWISFKVMNLFTVYQCSLLEHREICYCCYLLDGSDVVPHCPMGKFMYVFVGVDNIIAYYSILNPHKKASVLLHFQVIKAFLSLFSGLRQCKSHRL